MANFYARYPVTGGGVTSIDTITGAITLVAGSGISITDNSPSPGDITIAATGGGVEIEQRTISAPEAASKSITLTATPTDPTEVTLIVVGGTQQVNGVDFSVTGTTLSWTGLGLDNIGIVAGDVFVLIYNA